MLLMELIRSGFSTCVVLRELGPRFRRLFDGYPWQEGRALVQEDGSFI